MRIHLLTSMSPSGSQTPEPELKSNDENGFSNTNSVIIADGSSDEDEDDRLNVNGYELIPDGDNFGPVPDLINEEDSDNSVLSDEDDVTMPSRNDFAVGPERARDLVVDNDLVRAAMRNIRIDHVPTWAENLSEARWKELVGVVQGADGANILPDNASSDSAEQS